MKRIRVTYSNHKINKRIIKDSIIISGSKVDNNSKKNHTEGRSGLQVIEKLPIAWSWYIYYFIRKVTCGLVPWNCLDIEMVFGK